MKQVFLVLGTTSSCGKSFTSTALIRHLKKQGYKVAPFKAYNLSSKHRMLEPGKMISYSTYLQTLAADVQADPRMNPVYVLPKGSEMALYLNGDLYYSGSYREYGEMFPDLQKGAAEAFDRLAEEYDIIVMEGSGSPAEINCYDRDLANRFMAEYACPHTLLVGDIYNGGVFAALHGTLSLMPEGARRTVRSFMINRYCGDVNDLRSGIEWIEEEHGIKCIGVMPYAETPSFDPDDAESMKHYFESIEKITEEHHCFEQFC